MSLPPLYLGQNESNGIPNGIPNGILVGVLPPGVGKNKNMRRRKACQSAYMPAKRPHTQLISSTIHHRERGLPPKIVVVENETVDNSIGQRRLPRTPSKETFRRCSFRTKASGRKLAPELAGHPPAGWERAHGAARSARQRKTGRRRKNRSSVYFTNTT